MKVFKGIIIVLIIIIVGAIFINIATIGYSNKEIIEIEVKDKYIKRNAEKDIYMIVDTENNTYQITDLLFIGKFNSTDIYNQLEIGKKYMIEVTGIRNQVLSLYKNINKIIEQY